MAKIYETKEDLARDDLKAQAEKARHDATVGGYNGFLHFVAAAIAYLPNIEQKTRNKLHTIGASLFAAAAAFHWTSAWSNFSKARTLETLRDKLGPETVVLPPGVGDDASGGKLYSQAIEPKTLTQQAAKPAMTWTKG